ncbi:Na+/H+ antiporter subunit G [Profundibacterium mesophilum]|uniref:PH adaption potassium efflux system PhaG subunit n=1 Tax=Profundibacterium mesophilum KAUST100406-0324 TaxID=1037889 RepID=A0A921TDB4_9RHOB|nr:Na+/H+ antiporter subunit G [Profundibacterium mesophilum]KAF0676156.1 pH adaption potassium efflux system PhaG subunit [Profundibacterium mesophilum KAUST100406-0324]
MLIDALIAALLLSGAFFTLVGSIGLLKLNSPMSRLHGPTKASTLGVGSLLMASMVRAFAHDDGSLHEVLVMAFLFVTAPISGNFIAKVHLHKLRGKPDLAVLPQGDSWASTSRE